MLKRYPIILMMILISGSFSGFGQTTTKLGGIVQIVMGGQNLDESLVFYQKLGFRKVKEGHEPNPWIQMTDDGILLLLNQGGMNYIGLTYFVKNMSEEVAQLEDQGIQFFQKKEKGGKIFQAAFLDVDYMLGVNLLNYNPDKVYHPKGKINPVCGKFREVSCPVADLAVSIKYWEQFGFKKVRGGSIPYPWVDLNDGMITVGLHQTTEFDKPAITFFSSDMDTKIASLKKAGFVLKEMNGSKAKPGNALLVTPEAQYIFLLKEGS